MPSKAAVGSQILRALLRHRGVLKEFASGAEIVDEIADEFNLNWEQRSAVLERIYRKENRKVFSSLWHRLLFRAADSLAKAGLVSRPTATFQLSSKREWMLTEKGFDEALKLEGKQDVDKDSLGVHSFEVQRVVKTLISRPRPDTYDPVARDKRLVTRSNRSYFRSRAFRQAVIEAYGCKCAFCGFKLSSPDSLSWEVQAAHIVPNHFKGKDDIWNGLALCGIHHWAFDVGWLSVTPRFVVDVSSQVSFLSDQFAQISNVDLIRMFENKKTRMFLPAEKNLFPHENAIAWHRSNRFVV